MDWFWGLRTYQQIIVIGGLITIIKFLVQDIGIPIFKWFRKKFWQLNVQVFFRGGEISFTKDGKTSTPIDVVIKVFNRGDKPIFVRSPDIIVDTTEFKEDYGYQVPDGDYPKKINPGDELFIKYDLNKLYDDFLAFQQKAFTLHFNIKTTNNVVYRSNKFPDKEVENWYKLTIPKKSDLPSEAG